MRDIDRALADIGEIRSQLVRQSRFQGYGPATMAATALLAAIVGTGQMIAGVGDAAQPLRYFAIWMVTALVAVILVGAEAVTRSKRLHSRLADAMIVGAVEQFLPAGVAGALLALVIARFEPSSLWMLPGLWQILVSLGLFAASRSLPRAMNLAGAWYLVAGLAVLMIASGTHGLSPWMMAVPFGVGQSLIALILHTTLGGDDGEN